MDDEVECVKGKEAAKRFRALAKRVITTPKPVEEDDEAEESAGDATIE